MIIKRPARRITLHFGHIFLTELRTFIVAETQGLAFPIHNTSFGQVVWGELYDHTVSG